MKGGKKGGERGRKKAQAKSDDEDEAMRVTTAAEKIHEGKSMLLK